MHGPHGCPALTVGGKLCQHTRSESLSESLPRPRLVTRVSCRHPGPSPRQAQGNPGPCIKQARAGGTGGRPRRRADTPRPPTIWAPPLPT